MVRILNLEVSLKNMGNGSEFGRVKDLIGNGWIAAKDLIGKLSATWKESEIMGGHSKRERMKHQESVGYLAVEGCVPPCRYSGQHATEEIEV